MPSELFMNRSAYLMGYWLPPIVVLVSALATRSIITGLLPLIALGPTVTFVFFVRKAWRFIDVGGKRPNPI